MIVIQRLFFLFAFLTLLSLKNNIYILSVIAVLLIVDFKNIYKRSKRVIVSIFLFNTSISIGYIIVSYFKHISPWEYILYINLKVFMMTYFVFWFFDRVNVVKFFSFSKDFSYLLTMTLSQIFSYRKTFEDFKMAFKSRVVDIKGKEKTFIANTFKFFFDKAFKESKERALAMRARGFFENQG